MINSNYEIILKHVYDNKESLENIMKGLNEPHIDKKLNTVRFIIELLKNSKQFQNEAKERFFSELIKDDFISLLMEIMVYKETKTNSVETKNAVLENGTARIIGDEEMDQEYGIYKLELLKNRVSEVLSDCLQILSCKVS